jgi:hypothetical protein
LEYVSAQIERDPALSPYRAEEEEAFEALFSTADKALCPEFMEWEDKHHYRRGLENERLYLQGVRDGAQLIISLILDPHSSDSDEATAEAGMKTSAESEKEAE